ncbi:MAG: TerB family tellurite resistance protein, partial [Campylobacterota bacterium]|nr:TerB family tellurite resistance protein [Campylobacterota bacterium]
FYFIFIDNFFVTLSIILSLYIAFRLYKVYNKFKLGKLLNSKALFRKSKLGLFISLAAKVAKANGRVHELEAQLIGIMFDDISAIFPDKKKARVLLQEVFNEEKDRVDDTKEIAQALNTALGRSKLERKQFMSFLIQLALVDGGISSDENRLLREIASELNISDAEYNAIITNFENILKNKQPTISIEEACNILGVNENDDMSTIKKSYRKLVRQYHPDIIKSQDKDDTYMEEATAKTQEINQAYEIIKEAKK